MPIEVGQTYQSCKPRDNGFRIRVTEVGIASIRAVDASNGRRLLDRVPVEFFHDSDVTRNGKPRRSGYALVTRADCTIEK